jgi:hypothetical protein
LPLFLFDGWGRLCIFNFQREGYKGCISSCNKTHQAARTPKTHTYLPSLWGMHAFSRGPFGLSKSEATERHPDPRCSRLRMGTLLHLLESQEAAGHTTRLWTNAFDVVLEQALFLATRFPAYWGERWPQRSDGTCLCQRSSPAEQGFGPTDAIRPTAERIRMSHSPRCATPPTNEVSSCCDEI